MNSSVTERPPAPGELEISLFGPGIGECVVAHLGHGKWMIVDSCLSSDKTTSVALSYLDSLGVVVDEAVKLFVITHWHADHISGAYDIISKCSNAKVVFSGAWRSKEFTKLITASLTPKLVNRKSAGQEIRAVFDVLKTRGQSLGGPDHWAQDGMRLFNKDGVTVTSLSPSAETVTTAAIKLAELLPKDGDTPMRAPALKENDQSIVLQVETETFSTLLGGDLEVSSSPRRGWEAVIASEVRPRPKSSVFKVSHHGSHNGDTERLWTELLNVNPVALVSPYIAGRKRLPSSEDIERLVGRPSELYCTVWPIDRRPSRRNPSVDRTIREMALSHRSLAAFPGHVRLRVSMEDHSAPAIELFNGARRLGPTS